jgi:hypothetical protein
MVIESIFRGRTRARVKRFYLFRLDSAENRRKGGAAAKFKKKKKGEKIHAEKMISITIQWCQKIF